MNSGRRVHFIQRQPVHHERFLYIYSFESLSPSIPIVLQMASSIRTDQMNIGFCMSTNTGVSILESSVLLVFLGWFMRQEASERIAAVLWGAAFWIRSEQHAVSLCSYCLPFSPSTSLKSKWYWHGYSLEEFPFPYLRKTFYSANNMKELFQNTEINNMISFLKTVKLYIKI